MKNECTRRIIVPLNLNEMRKELALYATWYNHYRPHQTFSGLTPDQLYHSESRAPPINIKEHSFALHVAYLEGRRHLPVVELLPVADPEQRRKTA